MCLNIFLLIFDKSLQGIVKVLQAVVGVNGLELSTAILKLKGIDALCANLRDVCPTMRINI